MPNLGGRKANAISCGHSHSAIVVNDYQVVLFGENYHVKSEIIDLKPEFVLFKRIDTSQQE